MPDTKIGYEEQILRNTDMLVQYTSSITKAGQIILNGPHLMLTVDALAAYADEMTCSNPIRICTARGSVTAELGAEQLEGTTLELDASTRKLVLTRNAHVLRTF